ncbi:MAG: hypothetical protein WBM54_12200 [Woeseia sp.]
MTNKSTEVRPSYEIVSVLRTEAPAGTEGANWYRYVISFAGSESIEGCRQGNLSVVTGAVEEIVAQLNERHRGKHGRVHLVPTPKKPAASQKEASSKK